MEFSQYSKVYFDDIEIDLSKYACGESDIDNFVVFETDKEKIYINPSKVKTIKVLL